MNDNNKIQQANLKEISAKYSGLKNISQFSTSNSNGERISSSMQYIIENMNEIRSQIQRSGFLSKNQNLEFNDEKGVYETMNDCINSYFDITGELLEKMSDEAQFVVTAGLTFEEMDNELSNKAGEL